MSDATVLARKWRPKFFAQLAGQEHVVKALSNALTQNRLHHAYLFTGTRGVGKTTIARIFAKSLNCATGITATPCGECGPCKEIDSGRFIDLIELDAASNTGIDNMREVLESALYSPTSGRFKVYIIDEVHMLSKSAFNSMLKTLEEPPGHVKFILATTDPQKIPVTVLSRCLQFNLKQLPPALIASRLQYVLEQEKLSFEPAAINLIARAAQGSMRDALSLMDQAIAFSAGFVEEAVVRIMLSAIDQSYLFDLLEALLERNGVRLLEIADNMAARSIAFDAALQELATLLHRMALAQIVPQAIADDEPERVRLLELAHAFTQEDTQLFYQIAIHGRDEIDLAPDEYAGFTMTLLRMLAFAPANRHGASTTPKYESTCVSRFPHPILPPVGEGKNESLRDFHGKAVLQAASVAVDTLAPAVKPELALVEPIPIRQTPQRCVASSEIIPEIQDWSILLQQLNLQSMAQQLAKHCVLESFSDRQITLSLAQEHKHLQTNKMATEKLQVALSDYFAKPLKLNIVLGKTEIVTPAVMEQQTKQLKQQQAMDSIVRDDFVREAQTELGANLITESIKSLSQ